MKTQKITKKKKRALVTIATAVALFITSLVFNGNPELKSGINALIQTVSTVLVVDSTPVDTVGASFN